MTRGRGTRTSVAVAGLVLAVAASACTADPESEPAPEQVTPTETSASEPEPEPVQPVETLKVKPRPLEVRVRVRGNLSKPEAADLRRGVTRAVGRWMASGFTAGPLPRSDFSAAYATYTDGAARQARSQSAVTTNATLGPELVELVPTRRVARLSALAVGGRAAGATAQVLLVMAGAREDGSQVELVVRGELNLTPAGRGWKVFGFDLQRSVAAPGTYAAAARRAREREQRQERREREQRQERREREQRQDREQRRDREQPQRPDGRSR
jgi:hypothetical protein